LAENAGDPKETSLSVREPIRGRALTELLGSGGCSWMME
jgi:hypothetical protein